MSEQIRVVFADLDDYKELLPKHIDLTNNKISTHIGSFGSMKNRLSGLSGKFSSIPGEFSGACSATEAAVNDYLAYLEDLYSKLGTYIEEQKAINSN